MINRSKNKVLNWRFCQRVYILLLRKHKSCHQIGISAIVAFIFLVVTLYVSNLPVVFSSEKMLLQCYELAKVTLGLNHSATIYDESVILVNTHYADTLVIERTNDCDYGKVPVVNRVWLYQLLNKLKNQQYKYIILDIFLDHADDQPGDKDLYKLLAKMPRVIVGNPKDSPLVDSRISNKVGDVGYKTTFWESDFVKYRFKHNGCKSIALKMYEEITHDTTSIDGIMSRHNSVLTFEYFKDDWDINELQDVKDFIDDADEKIIIVGDFGDYNRRYGDTHSTYIGEIPGPIIHFNAYLFLLNGHHQVSAFLLLLLFFAFWWLTYQTLIQSTYTWLFMWIGYPVFLVVLFFFTYLLFNEVYDVLITSSLFYLLKTVTESFRERKLLMERYYIVSNNIKVKLNSIHQIWKRLLK